MQGKRKDDVFARKPNVLKPLCGCPDATSYLIHSPNQTNFAIFAYKGAEV